MIRGPRWRTRTTPAHRHRAAAVTCAVLVAVGVAMIVAAMWLLGQLGAPTWVVTGCWWLPTGAVLAWTSTGPAPAVATDDDGDTWVGYVIRWVLVGEDEPRELPLRIVAAVVLGAPIGWVLAVGGVLTVLGLA